MTYSLKLMMGHAQYAYMSTWQKSNDGDFSDRESTRTDWEMPGMDFPRAVHK